MKSIPPPSSIHFILTGGTIDSFFDGTRDTAVPRTHSILPRFLKSLCLYVPLHFTEVCMKDSRDITQQDVKKVKVAIEKSPAKKIIVTHGTYTMGDTGRYLKANLGRKDQTVLLTGSMIPIEGFSPSDGPFNLGYAVAEVQRLPVGVYVAMNGKIFDPAEIAKEIAKGRFFSVFGEKGK